MRIEVAVLIPDFISLTGMRLLSVWTQLHIQSRSMMTTRLLAVTFCSEISSRRCTWYSNTSQSSLCMCQKRPEEWEKPCGASGQTQDSRIEGEDSTTCKESESRTQSNRSNLPMGLPISSCLQNTQLNWPRAALLVTTPFPPSLPPMGLPCHKLCPFPGRNLVGQHMTASEETCWFLPPSTSGCYLHRFSNICLVYPPREKLDSRDLIV